MNRKLLFYSILLIIFASQTLLAANDGEAHGLDPTVLIGVAIILFVASAFGEIFAKLGQPAVLGELIAGIILGNLFLLGITATESFKTNTVLEALAQIGVIVLLFEVGLEINLRDLIKVGQSALLVAIIGIVTPFFLGWTVAYLFDPEGFTLGHIFIGAMLCANSIGITARVLRDLGRINDKVARIILSAAVIDDILALLFLAVVDGAIKATATGIPLAVFDYVIISVTGIGFLVGAILVGQFIFPLVFKAIKRFNSQSVIVGGSFSICFLTAYLASQLGLAAIIGAFAAGLILDEAHFEYLSDKKEHKLSEYTKPISALLAPIFFVFVGLQVDLRVFANPQLFLFAFALTLAAILGKQACSLGVLDKGISRKAVGLGMVPRGEVVLFFAGHRRGSVSDRCQWRSATRDQRCDFQRGRNYGDDYRAACTAAFEMGVRQKRCARKGKIKIRRTG